MKKFFLVKIRHAQKEDDGSVSFVTDAFIVFALTYADAEMLSYEYAEEHWTGTFRILSVARQNVTNEYGLSDGDDGEVFKLKYEFESEIDARQNTIKKFTEHYYVVSKNLIKAAIRLEAALSDNNALSSSVTGGSKLKIVDYICEDSQEETE